MNYPLSAAQTSKTHREGHQKPWIRGAFPVAVVSVLPSAAGWGLSVSLGEGTGGASAVGGSDCHDSAPALTLPPICAELCRGWHLPLVRKGLEGPRCPHLPKGVIMSHEMASLFPSIHYAASSFPKEEGS